MEAATQGILLRQHRYSETSLIVRWLTPDRGRIATLARGALRPSSPFRGRLDTCYLADLTLSLSRRSTLHTLKEVRLQETFPGLRRHYEALQQAAYAVRLLERATETDTPLPGLFPLLRQLLENVSAPSPLTAFPLWTFEWRLLAWSGQAPDPLACPLDPLLQSWLAQVLTNSPEPPALPQLTRAQITSLDRFLSRCLAEQFDQPPPSRPPLMLSRAHA